MSNLRAAEKLSALGTTVYSPEQIGKGSEISTKGIASLVPLIRLPEAKKCGRWIITEDVFVDLVLEQGLRRPEAAEAAGVSLAVISRSVDFYREFYLNEMKLARSRNHAQAMLGNTRGAKDGPAVVIDEATLKAQIEAGLTAEGIARELGVSVWFVHRSMEIHNISGDARLPRRLAGTDNPTRELLEYLAPGITELARDSYANPYPFYARLYDCFIRVQEINWLIQDLANSHRSHVETKRVERDHISWGSNRAEIILSRVLLDAGVPHVRQYYLPSKKMLDFAFPKHRLALEIDGECRRVWKEALVRDAEKNEELAEMGWTLIRVTRDQVEKDTPAVLRLVTDALKIELTT